MKSRSVGVMVVVALVALASGAQGALVELTWETTVAATYGEWPATVGETFTTILLVDNGGATVLSQTWEDTDFISYRAEGASSWWVA